MNDQYAIGWNIGGHEMILQDWTTGNARLFDDIEEAKRIASELVKDTGTARVLTVIRVNDPPENISPEDAENAPEDA